MISRCCKEHVYSYTVNDGESFYMCCKCEMDCATMFFVEHEKGMDNVTGREA